MPEKKMPDCLNSQEPHGPSDGKIKTLFLSDLHLGTRHCQADLIIDFLEAHESEVIYLIGDIIDGWRLKRSWYWPTAHDAVYRAILRKARRGVKVFYIPGNHDAFVRRFSGKRIRNVEILDHAIHETAAGRRYLVTHGDQYDLVVQNARWLADLGDRFYEFALTTNTLLNVVRARLGLDYWSLGAFAKRHVKSFVSIISQFETVVAEEVRTRELDGVICGHIHHAVIRTMGDIHYVNTGDWVETCSAVAEHADGRLEVIRWTDRAQSRRQPAPFPLAPSVDDRVS
ncbi:UDP-2,3-diacylglucosamine diphosphatase [Nisaea sp.]|uniref:UDP-2,3-diacylglucosamine diphosphatase n=1 Tax=Nisaea sp. TaxID=2024842 RepID=UPI003B52B6CD